MGGPGGEGGERINDFALSYMSIEPASLQSQFSARQARSDSLLITRSEAP